MPLKGKFPHITCQIDVKCYSMYIKITLESQIFILKALGYVRQFTRFRALYRMPQRAMGAAITCVHFQICDVNPGQLTDRFCKRSLVCISYKRA